MGMEYGLYDRGKKEFIDLGKRIRLKHAMYQIGDERLVDFLANHAGPFEMHNDGGDMLHWIEEGWTQVDAWHITLATYHGSLERFACKRCEWQSGVTNLPEEYAGARRLGKFIVVPCPKCKVADDSVIE